VGLDEGEHPGPGVLARVLVCSEPAIEERVRRALVRDELVLDAGCIESLAKGLDVGGDDIGVRASEQAQDWACVACCLHHGRGVVAGLLLRDPP
jgi:hypothetical protein